FFSSRRRHTRFSRDWSSDVCSSDLFFSFFKLLYQKLLGIPQFLRTLDTTQIKAKFNNLFKARVKEKPFTDKVKEARKLPSLKTRSEERRVGKECRYRR